MITLNLLFLFLQYIVVILCCLQSDDDQSTMQCSRMEIVGIGTLYTTRISARSCNHHHVGLKITCRRPTNQLLLPAARNCSWWLLLNAICAVLMINAHIVKTTCALNVSSILQIKYFCFVILVCILGRSIYTVYTFLLLILLLAKNIAHYIIRFRDLRH